MRHLLAVLLLLPLPSVALAEKPVRYAVIVGVREYDHSKLPVLQFSENDARELAKLLRLGGYVVELLCDTEGKRDRDYIPTKANIEAKLEAVLNKCKRDDLVLVAFAGHGLQFEKDPDCYFCPRDAKPFEDETKTLVSLDGLYRRLDKCGAGAKVLLADCCRNDPNASRGVKRNVPNDVTDKMPPKGVFACFSCVRGQSAYEHKDLGIGHGVFFYHLLEGLRGKAAKEEEGVEFLSLMSYVNGQMPKTIRAKIGQGAEQTPNLKFDISGQLVLLDRSRADAVTIKPTPPGKDAFDSEPAADWLDGSKLTPEKLRTLLSSAQATPRAAWIACDGYEPRRSPKKSAVASGAAPMRFLQKTTILLRVQVEDGEQVLLGAGEPGKNFRPLGWAPLNYLLQSAEPLQNARNKTLLRVIVIDSLDQVRAAKSIIPPIPSLTPEGEPASQKPLQSSSVFYVYADSSPGSPTRGRYLLGKKYSLGTMEYFAKDRLPEDFGIVGWVDKSRVVLFESRDFLSVAPEQLPRFETFASEEAAVRSLKDNSPPAKPSAASNVQVRFPIFRMSAEGRGRDEEVRYTSGNELRKIMVTGQLFAVGDKSTNSPRLDPEIGDWVKKPGDFKHALAESRGLRMSLCFRQ